MILLELYPHELDSKFSTLHSLDPKRTVRNLLSILWLLDEEKHTSILDDYPDWEGSAPDDPFWSSDQQQGEEMLERLLTDLDSLSPDGYGFGFRRRTVWDAGFWKVYGE